MSNELERRFRVQYAIQNLLYNFQAQNQVPSYMMVDALNKATMMFQEQSFAEILNQLDKEIEDATQDFKTHEEEEFNGEANN